MVIQVKPTLTATRNPTEHGFDLRKQKGEIVHVLGDNYTLVRFKQFKIQKKIKEGKRTRFETRDLDWYVHDSDYFIATEQF